MGNQRYLIGPPNYDAFRLDLGVERELLRRGFGHRIFRFDSDTSLRHKPNLESHLLNLGTRAYDYPSLGEATACHLIDTFFESLEQKGYSVSFYEGEVGESFVKGDFTYEPVGDGRSFRVSRVSDPYDMTEISRLIKVERGNRKEIYLCDIDLGDPPSPLYALRMKAAVALSDDEAHISKVRVYPKDVFSHHLELESSTGEDSVIGHYLSRRFTSNIILLLGSTTNEIKGKENAVYYGPFDERRAASSL